MPFDVRLANAAVAYVAYLGKTIWPAGLAIFYPHPLSVPVAKWAAAAAGLVVMTVAVLLAGRHRPYLAVGWLWYVGTLVPVIGLVQVACQAMADRYTYIPLIGIFIMAAWGLADLAATRPWLRIAAAAGVSAALAACLVVTWMEVGYWKNTVTLLGRALAVNADSPAASGPVMMELRGKWLSEQGRWAEAAQCFAQVVAAAPDQYEARVHLANMEVRMGKIDEAAALYREEVQRGSKSLEARNNLAWILATRGDPRQAAEAVTLAEQAFALSKRRQPSLLGHAGGRLCGSLAVSRSRGRRPGSRGPGPVLRSDRTCVCHRDPPGPLPAQKPYRESAAPALKSSGISCSRVACLRQPFRRHARVQEASSLA